MSEAAAATAREENNQGSRPRQKTKRHAPPRKEGGAAIQHPEDTDFIVSLFGGWATPVGPLALRPRVAPGLLLSEF